MNLAHTYLILREVFKRYNFISPNLAKLIMQILKLKVIALLHSNVDIKKIDIPYTLSQYIQYRYINYRTYPYLLENNKLFNLYKWYKLSNGEDDNSIDNKNFMYGCLTSNCELIEKYFRVNINIIIMFLRYYKFDDIPFAKKMLQKIKKIKINIHIFNPNIFKHRKILNIILFKLKRKVNLYELREKNTNMINHIKCCMPIMKYRQNIINLNSEKIYELLLKYGYIYEYYNWRPKK